MNSKKFDAGEREIIGNWILVSGKVEADEACLRIKKLIAEHLHEIRRDASGWDRLYRDADDGRYWELSYPMGYLHGGGPPRLLLLSEDEAKAKYG